MLRTEFGCLMNGPPLNAKMAAAGDETDNGPLCLVQVDTAIYGTSNGNAGNTGARGTVPWYR